MNVIGVKLRANIANYSGIKNVLLWKYTTTSTGFCTIYPYVYIQKMIIPS
jgi:hypothetical protein